MEEENTPWWEQELWVGVVISLVLVLFAGLTSGLSLGLLSHSKVDLEVLMKSGLPKDQKNAAKVLPVVRNECFLLCTLLIAKSLATEALPLFLDRILPFWSAILVSVIFVVAFVEVIPQAVCSKHGLSLGAKFTLFVRFLLFILAPVAYPLLDWLLGKNHSAIFRRAELKALVDLHGVKAGKGGDLTDDETTIISGALGMMEKIARDAMTPLSKAFSLDINSKLDMVYDDWPLYDVLKLFQEGHGHMAVVVKSEKDAKEASPKARNNSNKETNVACNIHSLGDLLSHSPDNAMKQPHGPQQLNRWERRDGNILNEELESLKSRFIDEEGVGIITMEDVLEELLQEDILDETDHHVEIHDKIRVRFLPSTRSSLSASRGTSLSSYYQTPILGSPLPLYASPSIRSSIATSRVKPNVNSSRSFSAYLSSLSFHQIVLVSNFPSILDSDTDHRSVMAANDVPCCETMFWVYLIICVGLVCFAGLMSGLTLGLMSLSLVDLEVLIKAGKPEDRKNADYPTGCLFTIWSEYWCKIIGDSSTASLNCFPKSYPISKLLDLLLGKGHSALLRRAELKTLVGMHGNEAGKGGELTHDETTIISGALDLTEKTAKDAMTPLSRVFSLDLNAKLDNDTMSLIISKGHSRVPIYSGSLTNIVGLVLVKNLIKCRPEDGTPIRNLSIRRIPERPKPYGCCGQEYYSFEDEEVLGIITMEDVLEQLLQEPIFDETENTLMFTNKLELSQLSAPF
ncbi:UNVERIFIED_CONTAM: DUF21 domain-containing protein [Sesamum radiatum]|uniref:DUF21 domain-containing protein n=1 Tax=Sesamum radiatum TaxID=300843 RepID=A0AAW2KES0_SESRA